ncbi:MAG: helix-turn-helix domain-containing protein, partial [Fuerstiella sp.]
MSRYRSKTLKQLTEQQVRFAPQAVRNKQILQAEEFLLNMDSSAEYSYAEVCFQVTGYRPEQDSAATISGSDLAHDLRCFVEDLSDSLGQSVGDFGEPVLTVQEVSQQFSVSAKTVDRWRDRGLASRRVTIQGRKRVVIRKSTLDRFVAVHQQEIDRSRSFCQMSDSEREQIIMEARSLSRAGLGLTEVSRQLGQKLNRATETVRYTLRDYDKLHPENAIFPKAGTQVSPEH